MATDKQEGITSLNSDLKRRGNNSGKECTELPISPQSINSVPSTERLQTELGLWKHVDWFIWSESGGSTQVCLQRLAKVMATN